MLAAGRLNRRVTIRRASEVPNGKGGYVTAWNDVATASAEVVGLAGREAVMDQVLRGVSVYRITMRFRGDIQQNDQLRYGEQDLNIRSATDPDGRREQLVMIADTASTRTG